MTFSSPLAARLSRLAPQAPARAAADQRQAVVDELRRRLQRLEQRAPAAAPRLPPGDIHQRATPLPLRGLESATPTPWGGSFSTEIARVGQFKLARSELGASGVAAALSGLEGPAPPELLHGLRVLDLETTGLAGGTGTLAFLIGVGGFREGGGFTVEQLLLGSPAHEPAFLDAFARLLDGATLIVSFNGRSFDVPLLRTRCVLARRPAIGARLSALPHLDLITAARRLWRARTGDCRLVSLEEAVLHRRRPDDCPGSLAPAAYAELLKSGDARLVGHIARHNRDDVAGTLALMLATLRILDDPMTHAEDAGELVAAAEHRLRHVSAAAALPVAERALELARTAPSLRRALLLLARLRRRLGATSKVDEVDQVEAIWRRYLAAFPHENRAYVELAKILEHKSRDLQAALTLSLAAPHPGASDVGPRITRLRRRLGPRAPDR